MADFNTNTWRFEDSFTGRRLGSSTPVDRRYVVDTFDNIWTLVTKPCRYPGLRIFVIDTEKEYWFKGGVNQEDLVEYHPEAFVTTNINEVDTTRLTPGVTVTIFDGNGNPTQYIWNGTSWKSLSIGGTPSPGGQIPVLCTNIATDTYEELITLLNAHISANNILVSTGTEIPVVFSDTATTDKNPDVFCKYVYLNDSNETGHWFLEYGIQVFEYSIPQQLKDAAPGTIITNSSNTSAKYVKFVKTENGVDVVIEHNFCMQYIDVVTYLKDNTEGDKDYDRVTDSDYGTQVLFPHACIKSNGKYRIVLSTSIVPDENQIFVTVLQK